MPKGAGSAPAGTSPAGFGLTDAAAPPQTPILPDWITGQRQTGRFLNQNTGDYQFTSDGRVQGMSTAQQLVLIALQEANFGSIQEKGVNYQRQVATVVQNALGLFIKQKIVELRAVDIQDAPANPDATSIKVSWFDVLQGRERQTVIGI